MVLTISRWIDNVGASLELANPLQHLAMTRQKGLEYTVGVLICIVTFSSGALQSFLRALMSGV